MAGVRSVRRRASVALLRSTLRQRRQRSPRRASTAAPRAAAGPGFASVPCSRAAESSLHCHGALQSTTEEYDSAAEPRRKRESERGAGGGGRRNEAKEDSTHCCDARCSLPCAMRQAPGARVRAPPRRAGREGPLNLARCASRAPAPASGVRGVLHVCVLREAPEDIVAQAGNWAGELVSW